MPTPLRPTLVIEDDDINHEPQEYVQDDDYDNDDEDTASDVDGEPVFGYHETTPIRQHGGWPDVTPEYSLCFGVELEMEHKTEGDSDGRYELSSKLGGRRGTLRNNVAGNYILARDGSLNESGVELITLPYTLDYHSKEFGWRELLKPLLRIARSGKGTESCGMHVHCNRKAISPLTLGKTLVFMNSERNEQLIYKVAQRSHSSYAIAQKKKLTDGLRETSSKYDIVHITRETIEFRMFKGNLRWDRVLKNIEFCHAVINYCQDASAIKVEAACTSGDKDGFIAWVIKRKSVYPNLVSFLAENPKPRNPRAPKPAFPNNEDI